MENGVRLLTDGVRPHSKGLNFSDSKTAFMFKLNAVDMIITPKKEVIRVTRKNINIELKNGIYKKNWRVS